MVNFTENKEEQSVKEEKEMESLTPSTSEKESTDASLEILVHATIGLPGSVMSDSSSVTNESTDTSHEMALTENINEPTTSGIDKLRKRSKKKKNKNKSSHDDEVSALEEQKNVKSIYEEPAQSRSSLIKLSYSDVAKKSAHQTPETDEEHVAVGKIESGMEVSRYEQYQKHNRKEKEVGLKVTFKEKAAKDKKIKVQETLLTKNSKGDTDVQLSIEIRDSKTRPAKVRISNVTDSIDNSKDLLSQMPSFGAGEIWKDEKSLSPDLSIDRVQKFVQTTQSTKMISDRLKNLQNATETSHLSNILHIASLENLSNRSAVDDRAHNVQNELLKLENAHQEHDIIVIEETLIIIVETISSWLETIEYKIFLSRKSSDGPSYEDSRALMELKKEVSQIDKSINDLGNIWKKIEENYPEENRERIQECMIALEKQVMEIENVAIAEEKNTNTELSRWDEFLNGASTIFRLVEEQQNQLEIIIESDMSTILKLDELEKIENTNRCHMWKTNKLLAAAKSLLRDYPGKLIPEEVYISQNITVAIEHGINIEREKLLTLLSLAEEYEHTLQEFAQITDVADDLLANPITVISLEHLQEEMQKHRKFFVNLNYCRAILESLGDNLDRETRMKHSSFHEELHGRASSLLDAAASRAQQMALAASRWMMLEQAIKEERGWLQVAHQRVPGLQTVTSSDYDQYISIFQTLSTDIGTHRARLLQLLNIASGLQELVNIDDPEDRYSEAVDVISSLQDNVDSSLRYLLAFRESWYNREMLINRLENWMARAEADLNSVKNDWDGHMRQFWELKAQYEVHNNIRNEANICFEKALRILPLSDEMLQRQYQGEVQERWHKIAERINMIRKSVADTISSEDTPVDEKLKILKRELNEIRTTIDSFHGVLKTEEELELYIQRLSVLFERVLLIQDELGRLGMLPAAESELVGILLSSACRTEGQIGEELESAELLRERLQVLQRGLSRIKKSHTRHTLILDQCGSSENQGSDVIAAEVERCQFVTDDLVILWKDIMSLRQLLHTLPGGMRISVSPVGIERDISNLQDIHTDLESRCAQLLSLLKNRLALWRRFERQLELVQQSVQEADYMMELLTVQGSVDYDRLLKATERLEGLNGDLGAREVLIDELREAAKPLRESCTPEVGEFVEAALNEAVHAWENTRAELNALCTKYQHAVRLWERYKNSSIAVNAWVDAQMGSVTNLSPEEARKQVKICEETLAEHKERLAELRSLVAQIASDVGLDASSPLQSEVEALGRRLEDVRETLSTLADTADARALNQELARGDLCQTKNFLDSVQQSLSTVGQGESKEQLKLLRNHLLALTKTEPQLQSIKERALEVVSQEISVVDVLQLWQRVFRETFQQYHRLSARLVRSEDVVAALRLWQEYLVHVQEFLSNDVPGDYNGLSEHRNLCEVHKNLLTDQQHLILSIRAEKGRDLLVAEQFNALTNLHNETLSKIMDRHASVKDRLDAWDKYRQDQSKLLFWLKDIERERSRLQLRFIHLRRLDKILTKIENLLDKLPSGEMQIDSLSIQQESLLADCEEALAVSIRMEHAANTQRITNLRASLETWKQFVLRIRNLNVRHVEQITSINQIFQEVSQILSSTFHMLPGSLHQTKQQLDSLQHLKTKLMNSTTDLETLGITTEQLRECLSPSDMKSLNQQCSLLWQQHGDLEHQLALLNYRLSERIGLKGKWENRLSRFMIWLTDVETRIHSCDSGLEEPEEALKRLEGELHAEMALKQRELDWISSVGQDLIEYAEIKDKNKLENSLDDVNERWTRLMNTGKARANKLMDLMHTMSSLEKRIAEIRAWLGKVELQLTEPFIVESKSQNTIDKKLKDHESLQKMIEAESGNIGEVLNLCEILLGDCDAWKTSFNTEIIKTNMQGLEKRWKATCVRSADRKRKITTAWKLIQELDKVKINQEDWIIEIEKELTVLEEILEKTSKEDTEQTLFKVKRLLRDIDAHRPALQVLEQSYSRLAKGGLEPDNLKLLTSDVRLLLDRWHALKPRANAIISALQREQKAYREFITAHGSAVIGLTQIDVKLTQVQHLSTPEQRKSPRRRLQQIVEIEKDLQIQSEILERADKLALTVMQDCHSDDISAIQELVNEYQLLWQDIKTRVVNLKSDLESPEKDEVDSAVQVETLKFEQDSAVQVDTLPRLMRMTSCDAYLMDLEPALNECQNSLDALEDAVTLVPIAGPGLTNSAKNIAKLIGSCQSGIELVKHLHSLLIQDGRLSNETAKTSQVEMLGARYDNILSRARAREQQIREIRSPLVDAYTLPCEHDGGRLTCPLCSRRNWTQLDIDLWRLEKWLEYAEGTQSEQHFPPSNIDELEDVIHDHREFLLDLDSHKSIVVSLNIVGTHLADHTENIERADELRDRLSIANTRWDRIIKAAGNWQNKLQTALMGNQQFHRIVDELFSWIERTEVSIKSSEPIDLTESTNIIRLKYEKFRELKSDLERCEPRVLSFQEVANQLLDENTETRNRLQELRLRLQSLRRLTGIYALKLGASLGLDTREVGLSTTTSSLASLSHDLLDQAASHHDGPNITSRTDGDENDQTVLVRGYRFVGRVLRASLPIQALMLVLLGVASLVPAAEDDYSCMLSNNFARTFTPVVDYPNGPPPL